MKGENIITVNQDTMFDAVQLWLDKNLAAGHGTRVTKVTQVNGYPSDGQATKPTFQLTVTNDPVTPA